MFINKELSNKLVQIIREAQPNTRFSGNTIQYGNQTFTLPIPVSQQQSKTTLIYR